MPTVSDNLHVIDAIDDKWIYGRTFRFVKGYLEFLTPWMKVTTMANMFDSGNTRPSVFQKAADRVKSAGPEVEKRVEDVFFERSMDKCVTILADLLEIHDKMKKDLNKLRPDHKILDVDDKIIQEGYTTNRSEERKKLIQKLETGQKAYDKAIKEGDYAEAINWVNNNRKSEGKSKDKNPGEPNPETS